MRTVKTKKARLAKQRPLWKDENLCSYCLFFQADPSRRRSRYGNCTYHKEWIENASFTTCSDMSSKTLAGKGIYRILTDPDVGRVYVARTERIRTRLFLIKR